jgi:hypothetical protein
MVCTLERVGKVLLSFGRGEAFGKCSLRSTENSSPECFAPKLLKFAEDFSNTLNEADIPKTYTSRTRIATHKRHLIITSMYQFLILSN